MPIKMMFCLTRKPGMSRADFQRYWLEEHAPKVLRIGPQGGMLRYVQSHSYESRMGDGAAHARGTVGDYDGVMEGWWESEAAARDAVRSMDPALGQVLQEDEKRFIDLPRSRLFMTREHIIF
jgi:hypothetical protein